MTEHVTPLRQRMIDDMRIRNMSPNSQSAYIQQVSLFARHFGKSPTVLGAKSRGRIGMPCIVVSFLSR
jgi:hypothetical protein